MTASIRNLSIHFDTDLQVITHVRRIKARSTEKFSSLATIAKRNWNLSHVCLSMFYKGMFIPIAM